MTKLNSIPCNIITGFLGVGKTTTILNLLKQKPANEKWAVLVNEFGEIGLDGALLSTAQNDDNSVFIKEVPGGCMCCASGLPMQIALNMLLMKAKPDRLLIEPTGLGHPKEVIKVLSGEHYQNILSLDNTITLVDARHFSSQKHLDNQTFQQQLEVADLLVANKADLYSDHDIQTFKTYLSSHKSLKLKPYLFIQEGALDSKKISLQNLNIRLSSNKTACPEVHDHTHNSFSVSNDSDNIPDCGYLLKLHTEAEFTSVGWRFKGDRLFDIERIKIWIKSLDAKRVKAVLNCETGFEALNISVNCLQPNVKLIIQKQTESRLEIIFEGREVTNDMLKNWTTFLTG